MLTCMCVCVREFMSLNQTSGVEVFELNSRLFQGIIVI